MPRLQFLIDGREVNIDFTDPADAGAMVKSVVGAFESMATERARVVRDIYPVASVSKPGTVHPVLHYGNGVFVCDCQGFQHRHYCRHLWEALDLHRSKYGS